MSGVTGGQLGFNFNNFCQRGLNLLDLTDPSAALTNLGLGTPSIYGSAGSLVQYDNGGNLGALSALSFYGGGTSVLASLTRTSGANDALTLANTGTGGFSLSAGGALPNMVGTPSATTLNYPVTVSSVPSSTSTGRVTLNNSLVAIGTGRTTNGAAELDLVSDTVSGKFSIVRASGTNGATTLNNTGTGGLLLACNTKLASSATFEMQGPVTNTLGGTIAVNVPLVVSGQIDAYNLGVFRNRVINGGMSINQRLATLTSATGTSSTAYVIDRWRPIYTTSSGTFSQASNTLGASDLPYIESGLTTSYKLTIVTATNASVMAPTQFIEGPNIADWLWGTASAQAVTLSFYFRTNQLATATTCITLQNSAQNYSFNIPVSVTTSGAWQFFSATIPGPTAGTWLTGPGQVGLQLSIGTYTSSLQSTNPSTWEALNKMGLTTATNFYVAAGAYWEFTGVQLEVGPLATQWELRPFALELALCERYYEKSYDLATFAGANSATGAVSAVAPGVTTGVTGGRFRVQKAKAPTFQTYGTTGTAANISTWAGATQASSGGINVGTTGWTGVTSAVTSGSGYLYHFTADAEF